MGKINVSSNWPPSNYPVAFCFIIIVEVYTFSMLFGKKGVAICVEFVYQGFLFWAAVFVIHIISEMDMYFNKKEPCNYLELRKSHH